MSRAFYRGYERSGLPVTILFSLLLHAALLAVLFFSPSFPSPRMSIGPVYDVALVDFPGGSPSGVNATPAGDKNTAAREELKTTRRVKEPTRRVTPSLPEIPVGRIEKIADKRASLERAIENIRKKAAASDVTPQRQAEVASSGQRAATPTKGIVGAVEKKGEGGAVGSGGALSSTDGAGEGDARINAYYRQIWLGIKSQWVLPAGMIPRDDVEAVISIVILRSGAVTDMKFEKKSGNRYFDESAMKAIRKADPLPPMPVWLNGSSLNVGIRFHSSDLAQ